MTKLRIAKDRKTGRSRGFAYLDFDNKENAEVAVAALAGKSLFITDNLVKN
jgi:RNA recognition motif-containing protein